MSSFGLGRCGRGSWPWRAQWSRAPRLGRGACGGGGRHNSGFSGGGLGGGDVEAVMCTGGSGGSAGAMRRGLCGTVARAGAASVAPSPSTASSSSVDIRMVPAKPRAHQGSGAPFPPQSIVQFVTASSAQHYPVGVSCQPLPAPVTVIVLKTPGFGVVRRCRRGHRPTSFGPTRRSALSRRPPT